MIFTLLIFYFVVLTNQLLLNIYSIYLHHLDHYRRTSSTLFLSKYKLKLQLFIICEQHQQIPYCLVTCISGTSQCYAFPKFSCFHNKSLHYNLTFCFFCIVDNYISPTEKENMHLNVKFPLWFLRKINIRQY